MLQYLVDSYLGGYGLPRIRTATKTLILDVDKKGKSRITSISSNVSIGVPFTGVVSIRLWPLHGTYLLFSDMTECWVGGGQRKLISTKTVQHYLVSSE